MKRITKIIYGIILGICMPIPGFSIGTMMLILGIQEDILNNTSIILRKPLFAIKNMLLYLIGFIIGFILGIIFLNSLLNSLPLILFGIYIGLIIGSIIILYDNIKKITLSNIFISLITFIITTIIIIYSDKYSKNTTNILINNHYVYIFVICMIAGAVMILPATSGTMVLLIFGLYDELINMLYNLIKLNINFDLVINLVFATCGILLGIILISKIILKLIKQNSKTFWCINIGLLSSSVLAIGFKTLKLNINSNYLNIKIQFIFAIILMILFTIILVKINKTTKHK